MRAEKFIGRTHKEIAIKGADVDGTVRRVVDGIDVGKGTRFVCESDYFLRVM